MLHTPHPPWTVRRCSPSSLTASNSFIQHCPGAASNLLHFTTPNHTVSSPTTQVATRLVAVRDSSVAMHKALAAADSGTEKHARHSVTAALLDTAPLYILLDMRCVRVMVGLWLRYIRGLRLMARKDTRTIQFSH